MSTLVSMTEPVLTSKSSGARYGMVECSAAVSWICRAREREVTGVGDGAREPRSIRMGVLPSSSIIMLPAHVSPTIHHRMRCANCIPGLMSLCAYALSPPGAMPSCAAVTSDSSSSPSASCSSSSS